MKKIIYLLAIILFSCNNKVAKTENKSTNAPSMEKKNAPTPMQPTPMQPNIIGEKTISAKKFEFKSPNRATEDTLILKTNYKDFMISPFGLFKVNSNNAIQLKTDFIVDTAYLHETKEYYYVFFTDTEGDAATSWIEKIKKKPLKSEYITQIYGFNLGVPIIYKEDVYVSAMGFVGKINLPTGTYKWKHNNLYDNERYSFNIFDTVLVNELDVEFISKNDQSKRIDKVIVDNKTGKIRKIIK
ncbi:hypothetical protein [Lacinutrix sp. MEBiC02404]